MASPGGGAWRVGGDDHDGDWAPLEVDPSKGAELQLPRAAYHPAVSQETDDLAAQHAELARLLEDLDGAGWRRPTRCDGWDVADVVLHLAQTDELAVASATGRFEVVLRELTEGAAGAMSVDEGAAAMVARQRGRDPESLLRRWTAGSSRLVEVLSTTEPSARVRWVAGELSARTLATTRLAEAWIHSGDVADALGVRLTSTDRLRPIARLAWRTLPYAFTASGRMMSGPVACRLLAPDGRPWDFLPDAPAVTTICGPADEFCAVAARRVDPARTGLYGEGPDVAAVLALVRTYA